MPDSKLTACAAYRGCMEGDPIDPIDDLFPEPDDRADSDADEHAPPRPVDRFRTTAVGSIVAAGLLGLRDALEGKPEKEEITIVSEAPTRPVDEHDVQVIVDEESKTVKVVLPRSPAEPVDPNG
jgi:hypothetical protein